MNWFKNGYNIYQGCILSPSLFNFCAEYIMWNARLDEAQTGIKITGRNINNRRYTDDTTLMAESKEELKSFLLKVKEESEKAGLKLSIQKVKIMANGPITSRQIEGGKWKQWHFRITANGNCRHEIKLHLLLGKKALTNLDSVLKSRDITLPTKVHIVNIVVFPISMYRCESWTMKKAECWRIDALEDFWIVVL